MGEQEDVHPAPEQRIQGREEFREFLRQDDVALAIAEILDGFLVCLPADGLRKAFLQPIRRVDHESLETVVARREIGNGCVDVVPLRGLGEAHHVQVMRAAFGIEEHGFGKVAGERRFADALRAVDYCFLGSRDATRL